MEERRRPLLRPAQPSALLRKGSGRKALSPRGRSSAFLENQEKPAVPLGLLNGEANLTVIFAHAGLRRG